MSSPYKIQQLHHSLTLRHLYERVFHLSSVSESSTLCHDENSPSLHLSVAVKSLYGVSILTGIGFTMSLFVGNLAFIENTQYIDGVKIGVLSGSLLSTVFGFLLLLISAKKKDANI